MRPDPEFESKNCVPLFWFLMFDEDEEHFATVESYQGTHRRRYFRVERVIALARLEAT